MRAPPPRSTERAVVTRGGERNLTAASMPETFSQCHWILKDPCERFRIGQRATRGVAQLHPCRLFAGENGPEDALPLDRRSRDHASHADASRCSRFPLSRLSASRGPVGAAYYDTHLTRAPYLTDLVGLHVIVNFATDQSGTTASVSYGPFDGTTCTLPVDAERDTLDGQGRDRERVPVEGFAHAAERGTVLLPRDARRRRPARSRGFPRVQRRRQPPARLSRSRSRSSATGASSTRTATIRISRTCSARSPAAASASRSRPETTATRPEARRTTAT